ncbi:MAG: hypothetical protein K8W52_44595 [Deltaproteobacteria bacterium]|nr:hypothetical protein [Deltaproteobacteria bacterium]
MKTTRAAVLVLLVACGAKTPAGGIGNQGAGATTTGPAPTVTWNGGTPETGFGGFTTTGLPAIAADGSAVLLAVVDDDGARGFPNLALVERGRDDRDLATRVVLALPTGNDEPAAPTDVAGANQWLTERHRLHDWKALTAAGSKPAPDEAGGDESEEQVVTLGAVEVHWNEGHLVVTSGGATMVDATHADWTVKPYPMCQSCAETCENPSSLRAVVGDVARRLIVVTIGYHGNDSCWEPTAVQHVVSW